MSKEHPPRLIPAAQYLRASTEHQRYSVPSQKAAIALYALERGYEIVSTYVDDGKSGVTIAKRDGLKQLLADALAGEAPFAVVLVLDVSRWGRFQNPDQAAHYEFICREAGVRVRYCAEAFEDDDSTTSSLMKGIKRVMAAEYSRQLSDRCKAGKRRQALAGARGGGPAPFAFVRQVFDETGAPGPILKDGERRPRLEQVVRNVPGPPEDVATVRRIFRMFVQNPYGYARIARILNDSGVSYRGGRCWTKANVAMVLRNEVYLGILAFGQSSGGLGAARVKKPRKEWERRRICPPVVLPKLFAAAQAKAAALNGSEYTDDELLVELRRLLNQHGYLTRGLIDQTRRLGWSAAYQHRFGSIAEAYRRVDYTPPQRSENERRVMIASAIIDGMKRLLAEKGYLSGRLIERCPHLPSVKAVKIRFGSLDAAYRAAGFEITRSDARKAAHARRRARDARLAEEHAARAGAPSAKSGRS